MSGGPIAEQRDRVLGGIEGTDLDDALVLDAQWFAARRQYADVRTVLHDRVDELGHRVEQVLTVVDHDEGASIREVSVDATINRLGDARRRLQTERGRDRAIRRFRVGDRRQVDEFGAVGERRLRRSRRLDGEPSLPTASDSRERYEPVRVQFDGDCVQFPAASDERRPGLRQAIAPRLRSPQRRELRPQCRRRELVHAFFSVEPAQAVFAEIDPLV